MTRAERDTLLARLWCYICLVPQDLSPAYALQSELPPASETLWVEFLSDLTEGRLGDREAQERYLHLFPEGEAGPAAMAELQEAWHAPRMALLREQMEKDIRALHEGSDRRALVPAACPAGRGDEGTPQRGAE